MTIPLHQPVVCPILIGRNAEMTALQECIEAAARGQGGIVLLSGEAGIGKSRLMAELQRSASALGFPTPEWAVLPSRSFLPVCPPA